MARAQRRRLLHLDAEQYKRLVEGVLDYAIFMLDPDGYVVSWNAGAARINGYDHDEIIGEHLARFYPPEDVEAGKPEIELTVARRDGRFEDEGWRVRKDGSRWWANVVVTALSDNDGSLVGFAKVTRDLTERKEAEEALRRSEETFRLLVESVMDYAIFMLDPDGHIVSWNAGAERIKGYSRDEIIGSHFSRFYPTEDVEAGKPVWELEVAVRDGRVEDEGWRVRKDGTRFWANVVITALFDHNGELRGFAKVTRDLTERKRTEEFRDRFIENAAHEIRTPLNTIRGFAETLLVRDRMDAQEVDEAIAALNRGTARLTTLVQNLLDLTQLQRASLDLRPEKVEVADVVREALEVAPAPPGKTVAVSTDGAAPAIVDPTRLVQVLTNLLVNAYRYGGSHVQIEIRHEDPRVEVVVGDDGGGIPHDIVSAMFDPFVRGDNVGIQMGSGLGLSLVAALVEAMGGDVRYERRDSGGARFFVSVPAADSLRQG